MTEERAVGELVTELSHACHCNATGFKECLPCRARASIESLQARLSAAESNRAEAMKYARHNRECEALTQPSVLYGGPSGRPCSCGLAALRAR